MKTYKTVNKKVEEIENVICNKCGKNLEKYNGCFYGLTDVLYSGGYNSINKIFITDMQSIKFDVCESCLEQFCRECKISPLVI